MTENEWLTCTNPVPMLSFLQMSGQASARKLRLFAVACSRRVWHLLDDLGKGAVEMAELFAEGLTGAEELRAARLACKNAGGQAGWYAAISNPLIAARNAALSAQSGLQVDEERMQDERIAQAKLLRDIFGNPFSPIVVEPRWRSCEVISLAGMIYEQQNFAQMPQLADALRAAGCTCQKILDHCCGKSEHVRGCWPLDLLLEKT